jgi:hypothetical protein
MVTPDRLPPLLRLSQTPETLALIEKYRKQFSQIADASARNLGRSFDSLANQAHHG